MGKESHTIEKRLTDLPQPWCLMGARRGSFPSKGSSGLCRFNLEHLPFWSCLPLHGAWPWGQLADPLQQAAPLKPQGEEPHFIQELRGPPCARYYYPTDLFFTALRIEPRVSCTLGKCFTMEPLCRHQGRGN